MPEFIQSSAYFAVALTLIAFSIASACQKKWKSALLNPILISAALIIAVLKLAGISNEVYQSGCRFLNFLLTPATICLAVSFYEQFQHLKPHLPAVCAGIHGQSSSNASGNSVEEFRTGQYGFQRTVGKCIQRHPALRIERGLRFQRNGFQTLCGKDHASITCVGTNQIGATPKVSKGNPV